MQAFGSFSGIIALLLVAFLRPESSFLIHRRFEKYCSIIPVEGQQCFVRNPVQIFRLAATNAKESYEKIDPAVYSEDLYGVLGVSSNASREELKEAYWAISFKNHPDRNNTIEALYTFRNASYAYKVLGKDRRTRAEYDSKLKSKSYFDVLEEVSNDVIAPLAMGVAVPLLNLTVQSISSFAFPFIRDAMEQSSAVLKSAFQQDNGDDLTTQNSDVDPEFAHLNFVMRTSSALKKTQYEQTKRKIKENIEKSLKQQEVLEQQVQEAIAKEKVLLSTLSEQKKTEAELFSRINNYASDKAAMEKKYSEAASMFNSLKQEYDVEISKVGSLQATLEETIANATKTEKYIVDLEEKLRQAKQYILDLNSNKASLQKEINSRKDRQADMYAYLVSANTNRQEKQQALDRAKEIVDSSKSRLLAVTEESNLSKELAQRQSEYRAIVEKKLHRTGNTTVALQAKLLSIETRWKQALLEISRRKDYAENLSFIDEDNSGDAFADGTI